MAAIPGAAAVAEMLGLTLSEAVAFAAGAAMAPALHPYVQDLKNETWSLHPSVPLDPAEAARLVVEQRPSDVDPAAEAKKSGIDGAVFGALKELQRKYPGLAESIELYRRKEATDEQVKNWLNRNGFSESIAEQLFLLKDDRLTPAQVALGIVRSLLKDPGFLPVDLDITGGKVPSYGVSDINPVTEAYANGIDKERLRVMVGEIGLPMGLEAAASAVFRDIIKRADFNRAVLEGNTRPEWADAIFDQARQIPTARDFFENALRGYHDLAWAQDQAERHGMSHADSLVIYQNQGRPMNVRQITQALSRGGKFNPEPGELTDPYKAAIVEGNVKPAYYDLAESLKYTLPSPFVMRQLTSSGVWSEAKAAKRLKDSGWIPSDADEAAKAWAGGGGTAADPHIKKAQGQLYNTTRSAYLAGDATDAVALAKLPRAGVSAGAVNEVLALWKDERDVDRQRLTAAQLKKAYAKAVKNPLTDLPWTRDEVLAELLARGWNSQDANTFLDTPSGP